MRVGFGFSSVTFRSRVFQSAFSVTPVLTRTNRVIGSCPHVFQTFKMLWQILRADNVCTLWFRYFISSYYSTRTWTKQNCCGSELNTTCLSWMVPNPLCSSSPPLSTHVNMCVCLVFSSRRIWVSTSTFPVSAVPASTSFANYGASGVRLTRSLRLH